MSIDLAPRMREGRALYVLIPLLVLNLTLLSVQIEDPGGTLLFKKWVLVTEEPFLKLSSSISGGIQNLLKDYIWLHGAREENRQLQGRVRELTLQVESLERAKQENLRLQQLLVFTDNMPFQSVGARVVGRTPDFMSNVVYLDRGWAAGIGNDDPVVSAGGVVGRIILVSTYHCQVQLITNPDASIGVMVERTRSPGVLKGSGDHRLTLDYISNAEQVNVGDVVISSGLDRIYPKGLLVGRVAESHKGKSVFRVIQVEPSADLLHLEDVLVVTGNPKPYKDAGAAPVNR